MKRLFLAFEVIFVLALIAYSNSFTSEFHFDDTHQIVKNPHVRYIEDVPRFFTDAGSSTWLVGLKGYRPVTMTSFAISYALSGYRVFGWHVFNFVLHFVNALLLFLIVRESLKVAGRNADEVYIPLAAALIFAVHPVQTNAVTYISGRAVLLAAFFSFLSFYFFLRYRSGGRVLFASLSAILYLLGLLSKEVAVSLPLLIFAYDILFAAGLEGGVYAVFSKRRAYYLWLAVTIILYLSVKRYVEGRVVPVENYPETQYLMSEAKVLVMYIRLLFLPINQNADYVLPLTTSFDAHVLAAAAMLVGLFVFFVGLRRKYPAAAFFGIWFFITAAPESAVPITDLAEEYRVYIPSAGFIAAVAIVSGAALKSINLRRMAAASACLLLLALTVNRNQVWATETTLWSDVAEKSPHSARAHGNLGYALLNSKEYSEAYKELTVALSMDSADQNISRVHNNLGHYYLISGKDDEAIREYKTAIRMAPSLLLSYVNLADVYGKEGMHQKAADVLKQALKISPEFTPARIVLAGAYTNMGMDREALAELKEAYKVVPRDFDVNVGLAVAYMNLGMRELAVERAKRAVELAQDERQGRSASALLRDFLKRG